MKNTENNLSILKIKRRKNKNASANVPNYFDDLRIINITGRNFSNFNFKTNNCDLNIFSLEFISTGKLKLHLDKNIITLNAPIFFWIGDHYHTFKYEHCIDCDSYTHYWIDFSGERGRRIYEWLHNSFDQPCLSVDRSITESIVNTYETMILHYNSNAKYYHSDLTASLESLLAAISRQRHPAPLCTQTDPYDLAGAAEMFMKNPFDHFDIEQMASFRGLSHMHFRALFRARYGQPINSYILSTRMQQAAGLLLSGKLRVSEVAELCGFSELSSFSRMFKRFYTLSPRKFLAEKLKKEPLE